MGENLVLFQRQGRVATLTLNRPEKRNALTPEMLEDLAATLTGLREDAEVRCIVLRGAGKDAFSAGFDIERIAPDAPQPGENVPRVQDPYVWPKDAITLFPYPVIAMIYGFCIGTGLEMAVACDLRIAADSAQLGITPAKLGIVYNHDPIQAIVDLVGPAYAKELFYTGRLVDAQRAYTMSLAILCPPSRGAGELCVRSGTGDSRQRSAVGPGSQDHYQPHP
ncbi:enoyl-CoA hydratase/isomerase family protein [Chloroflexota bacterium]